MEDFKCFSARFMVTYCANGGNEAECSEQILRAFYQLTERMLRVNQTMNLTALTDVNEIVVKHYIDCAFLARLLPRGVCVADVGAGAGFPTLPLAILRPDLSILAIDATEKRMRYVAETAREIGCSQVETYTARAEDLGRDPAFREQFAAVTARAVARLNVLCEWCVPLLRLGGNFYAMKGAEGEQECALSNRAVSILGAGLVKVDKSTLVDPSAPCGPPLIRTLVQIEKLSPTPDLYPRRNAKILSSPL